MQPPPMQPPPMQPPPMQPPPMQPSGWPQQRQPLQPQQRQPPTMQLHDQVNILCDLDYLSETSDFASASNARPGVGCSCYSSLVPRLLVQRCHLQQPRHLQQRHLQPLIVCRLILLGL